MRAQLLKLLLRLAALLPLSAAHRLGAMLGAWVGRPGSRLERVTRANVEACFPDQDEERREALLRSSLIESGKTLTETGLLWFGGRGKVERLFQEVHGEALLQQALAGGRGVIMAAPHLGSWEAVNLYCSSRYPLTSLYRPPRMAALDETVRKARQRFGAELVPTNARGVKRLYKALSENGLLMILPDQDPRRGAGEFAPFFGIQANTMTLLSRLAQKSGAAVICAYAERLPHSRGFALHFQKMEPEINDADVTVSLAALNRGLERAVRNLPEQYQWGYKRFETRPQGEAGFYK